MSKRQLPGRSSPPLDRDINAKWLGSAGGFLVGFARRGWAFISLVLLDVTEIAGRIGWDGVSKVPPFVFWPIVSAGLLWASICTYHDQRSRTAFYASEVARLEPASRPIIRGTIHQMRPLVGVWLLDLPLTIANTGAPTKLKNWHASAMEPDGSEYELTTTVVETPTEFMIEGKSRWIRPEKLIVNLTRSPLQSGDDVDGHLLLKPPFEVMEIPLGTVICVSCVDVYDGEHSFEFESKRYVGLRHVPGIDDQDGDGA